MDITKVNFESIIKNAKESENGFNELYYTIEPYVVFKAKTILGSIQDAEDIFQNVSVSIYRNLNNIDPKKFLGYLKTTVSNACNDVLRKRIKTTEDGYEIQTVEIDAYDDYKLPSEDLTLDLTTEYRSQVFNEVLDKIPADYRQVLVLRLIDEMTFKEIANHLNVAESTVKYRFASSLKIAEQEIIRIQKRDDIKLYSYSPLAFFLFLFRKASENEIVNTLLVNKTVQYITNELVSTVSKGAVSDSVGKAITSGAIKAGTAGLSKSLIAAAIVGVLGVGGIVGYNIVESNKKNALIESYKDDKVNISFNIDETRMNIGDKQQYSFEYDSQNDLEYIVNINSSNTNSVVIDDNTIEAVGLGKSTIEIVLTNPVNNSIKTEYQKNIIVQDKDNLGNIMGREMLKHGYKTRTWYQLDLMVGPDGRTILPTFEEFNWDDYYKDYSTWANEDMLDPKTGENIIGKKGSACDINSMCSTIYINDNGYISEGYYYNFIYNDDTVLMKSRVYQGEDLTLLYDEESSLYYYDGVNGKIYLDSTIPFEYEFDFPIYRSSINKQDYSCIYDENYRLIETIWNDNTIKYIYDGDRLIERESYINGNLGSRTIYYYDDNGLLFGQVTIEKNRVYNVKAYAYR